MSPPLREDVTTPEYLMRVSKAGMIPFPATHVFPRVNWFILAVKL